MRKPLSSLVLLLALSLMTFAPWLASLPQSLPACCRAGGKHHCAAMADMGGKGFQAQTPHCPYRSGPAVTPTHVVLQLSRAIGAVTSSASELSAPATRTVDVPSPYCVPKRGPPIA